MPSNEKIKGEGAKIHKKRSYKLYLHPNFDKYSVSERTLRRLRKLNEQPTESVHVNLASEGRIELDTNFPACVEKQSTSVSDNWQQGDEIDNDTELNQIQSSFVNSIHNNANSKTIQEEYTSLYEEVSIYKSVNDKFFDEVDENQSCSDNEGSEKSYNFSSTESSDGLSTDGSDVDESNERKQDGKGYYFNTKSMQGYLIMFPEAELLVSDVLLMCEAFSTTKGFSRKDQEDLIEFVKRLAGPRFENWNASHYMRSQCYDPPADKINLHFFCTKCNTILAIRHLKDEKKREAVICNECENDYNLSLTNSNYFIMIDLEFQIKLLLSQPELQASLLQNLKNIRSTRDTKTITDIYDSELYKKLQSDIPNVLTFNFNADGAAIFNSSRKSFWNILLCINELPPKLRFKTLLIAGVFVTNSEPKHEFMKLYLTAFCEQVKKLREKGVQITHYLTGQLMTFHFDILAGCVDTVARPILQARIQFSGYWGCSWCYARGMFINGAVRFILSEEDPELRTNERYVQEASDAEKLNKIVRNSKRKCTRSILGVKGASAFVESAPFFDNIWGFPAELLHGPELGIGRQQWNVLTSNETEHHLKPLQIKQIDQRLRSITPCRAISRSPKPISECAQWKASQWSDWILYWSILCLDGLVHAEYLETWALFVRSLYKLSSCHITEEDLRECDYDLLKFVGQFQGHYGEGAVTFNIHSALHFVTSVRKTGPTWATSAYPFEGGIFKYKKLINGPKEPAHQIAKKSLRTLILLSNIDNATDSTICRQYCRSLFEQQRLKQYTKSSDGVAFLGVGQNNGDIEKKMKKYLKEKLDQVLVFKRCVFNNILLHGSTYKRVSKTNDSVVLMQSGEIVNIDHLILVNETGYIYGSVVRSTCAIFSNSIQLSYIHELVSYDEPKIIGKISCIAEKVMRVSVNQRTFIIRLANSGEHQ